MKYDNTNNWQWTVQLWFGAWTIKEYHPTERSANDALAYWSQRLSWPLRVREVVPASN